MLLVILVLLSSLLFYFWRRYKKSYWNFLVEAHNPDKPLQGLHYNPRSKDLECLVNFNSIKLRTHCLWSSHAQLWGCCDWEDNLTLEQNVIRSLPTLEAWVAHARGSIDCLYKTLIREFTDPWVDLLTYFKEMKQVRKGGGDYKNQAMHKIFKNRSDGFVIEIRGQEYVKDFESYCDAVRRVITILWHFDPDPVSRKIKNGKKMMVDPQNWILRFGKEALSVTSFWPGYGSHHSRFMFGAAPDSIFILIQSESTIQFFETGQGSTASEMNWMCPRNSRERVRCRYKEEGRPYALNDKEEGAFPFSFAVVHPENLGEPAVEWWIPKEKDETEHDL